MVCVLGCCNGEVLGTPNYQLDCPSMAMRWIQYTERHIDISSNIGVPQDSIGWKPNLTSVPIKIDIQPLTTAKKHAHYCCCM